MKYFGQEIFELSEADQWEPERSRLYLAARMANLHLAPRRNRWGTADRTIWMRSSRQPTVSLHHRPAVAGYPEPLNSSGPDARRKAGRALDVQRGLA